MKEVRDIDIDIYIIVIYLNRIFKEEKQNICNEIIRYNINSRLEIVVKIIVEFEDILLEFNKIKLREKKGRRVY